MAQPLNYHYQRNDSTMPNSTQPSSLQELLNSIGQKNDPFVVSLTCDISSSGFLMNQVLDRLKQRFKSEAIFLQITAPFSKTIKMELQSPKNPTILLIHKGEIKQVFSGIIPYLQLAEAIKLYI